MNNAIMLFILFVVGGLSFLLITGLPILAIIIISLAALISGFFVVKIYLEGKNGS